MPKMILFGASVRESKREGKPTVSYGSVHTLRTRVPDGVAMVGLPAQEYECAPSVAERVIKQLQVHNGPIVADCELDTSGRGQYVRAKFMDFGEPSSLNGYRITLDSLQVRPSPVTAPAAK